MSKIKCSIMEFWGQCPTQLDSQDPPEGCSPTADFIPDAQDEQSEADEGMSDNGFHGSDSEISDEEGEKWIARHSSIASGFQPVADCRLFLSSSGKLHKGRPGDPNRTMCGCLVGNMVIQACGDIEVSDDVCTTCTKVEFAVRKKGQELPGAAPLISLGLQLDNE